MKHKDNYAPQPTCGELGGRHGHHGCPHQKTHELDNGHPTNRKVKHKFLETQYLGCPSAQQGELAKRESEE
jgi:hypothetical protein